MGAILWGQWGGQFSGCQLSRGNLQGAIFLGGNFSTEIFQGIEISKSLLAGIFIEESFYNLGRHLETFSKQSFFGNVFFSLIS